MKKILPLLLAALIAFSLVSCAGTAEKKKPDETGTAATESVTDESGNVLEEKELNEDGSVRKETKNTYDKDGKLTSTKVISYEDGKVVSEQSTDFSGDKQFVSEKKYTYGEDGTVKTEISEDGVKVNESVNNADGSTVSSTTFNEAGSVKSSYENGNIVKSESFDTEGKLIGYSDFKYDESGKATGSETFNDKNEQIMKSVYEYQEGSDKKSKILMYNSDGSLYQTGVYDENGKLTLYDAEGNPVK